MKTSLSSLDLKYLVEELGILVNSKIDKITQPGKNTFIFQFFVSGTGKLILRIDLPGWIYITEKKESAEKEQSFCSFLKKYLMGSRLRSIKQLDFERILLLGFDTKEGPLELYIELFSKGNLILCKNEKILLPLNPQKWKDRTVKKDFDYLYPKKEYNFLKLKKDDLLKFLKSTEKENLVKAAAIDLGLGGEYAEELCFLADVDKNKKAKEIEPKEFEALYQAIGKLKDKTKKPNVAYDKGSAIDALPFELEVYKENEKKYFSTFSKAIDFLLSQKPAGAHGKSLSLKEEEINTLKKIMHEQQLKIKEMEEKQEEESKKAELIYENYAVVKDILESIRTARQKYSWEEIKEKLKGHKIVKQINEKEGTIVVEL